MTLLTLLTLMLPSCVAAKWDGGYGVAVGTDAAELNMGPQGVHAVGLNQSTGTKEMGKRLLYNTIAGAVAAPLGEGIGTGIKSLAR